MHPTHVMHPAYQNLEGATISVDDEGETWLMHCRRGSAHYQVRCSKQDISAADIQAHARTTFAAILGPKRRWPSRRSKSAS